MPYRRIFQEDAYYHVFNRGVEKRIIFQDDQDRRTFLDIMVYYLTPINTPLTEALRRTGLSKTGLFFGEITLIAYGLMPNHFHLILHQKSKDSVTKMMRRVGTAYSMYFNRRYNRVGSLFQGRFKAKHLDSDNYFTYTSKYIHRNPLSLIPKNKLPEYQWSSYQKYLNPLISNSLVQQITNTQPILNEYFKRSGNLSYKAFVEETPSPDWYQEETDAWLGN
jgi:putative transposase